MLAGASAPSDWYQRGVRQVLLQVVDDVLQPADELAVLGQRGQPLGRDLAQHLDRVAVAGLPERGVERLEEVTRLRVPGPPEVRHELGQGQQGFGQRRADGEPTESSHRSRLTSRTASRQGAEQFRHSSPIG